MKCFSPLILLLALAAQTVATMADEADGSSRAAGPTERRVAVSPRGELLAAERSTVAPAQYLALRAGRTRAGVPVAEIREDLREPSYARRFAPHVELPVGDLKKSGEGPVWSLTAVHRARAELRAARGRQSDP